MLADLFITHGTPGHIVSANGPEFAAVAVRGWITGVQASTTFIEPGSPWENGTVESLSGKLLKRAGVQHPGRGPRADRAVAGALQHDAAALGTRLPASCAEGDADGAGHAVRHPKPNRISPAQASHALTFCPDHPVGAGQAASDAERKTERKPDRAKTDDRTVRIRPF